MTVMQVVFLVTAVVSLGGAVMVVTTRNLIHAALWLILTLFGVAVMYGLLSAPFFTVIQVVIYIGAIAILMIFAIMLTRRVKQEPGSSVNKGLVVGRIDGTGAFYGFGLDAQYVAWFSNNITGAASRF